MSYLEFIPDFDDVCKTSCYHVASQKTGDALGMIHYYPQWKQYVFSPVPQTVWSVDCLKEVEDIVFELNKKSEVIKNEKE